MKKKLLIIIAIALIVACSKTNESNFNGSDITLANLDSDFNLTDHNGNNRSIADFREKVVAIFFGFTHCPDICPTSMLELKAIKAELGVNENELQVLFITVDPERDTVEVLNEYVPSFDKEFLGLTGKEADIKKVAQQYKVFFQKVIDGSSYTVDHSSGIYLIGKDGRVRIRHPYGSPPNLIAEDILKLI